MSATVVARPLARFRALLGTRRGSMVVRSVGYGLVFVGFLLLIQGSLLVGLWLAALGWLLTRAARSNYNVTRLTSLLDDLRAADALDPDPGVVVPGLWIETLLEEDARQAGGSGVYLVRSGETLLGVIDVLDADRIPREDWGRTRVEQLMRPVSGLEAIRPDMPLLEVVARFERDRREAYAVVDPAEPDRLVGLVTRERVHALMRSRAARSRMPGSGRGR